MTANARPRLPNTVRRSLPHASRPATPVTPNVVNVAPKIPGTARKNLPLAWPLTTPVRPNVETVTPSSKRERRGILRTAITDLASTTTWSRTTRLRTSWKVTSLELAHGTVLAPAISKAIGGRVKTWSSICVPFANLTTRRRTRGEMEGPPGNPGVLSRCERVNWITH